MITYLDNSTDDYNGHILKILILQVIQHIFCVMLIGWEKIVNSDGIFSITNMRINAQEDSLQFEALIHEILSVKKNCNEEICHIDLNCEKRICTVSTYIK